MPIDFTPERWRRIKDASRRWWAGELDRPLIQVRLWGRAPSRPAPALPMKHFTAAYDFSVSPDAIVDAWDYHLSQVLYLGDAFPTVWPNFGPGIIAGFLGGQVKPEEKTVWFGPARPAPLDKVEFRYDPQNVWFRRVQEVMRAAQRRWNGLVQVGMTDLGGNLDILSSFRPGEELLLDLVDDPETVKRKTWEAHDLWFRYFAELNALLQPANPGYTGWAQIFSPDSYYMLQCDFCYMIGPKMFDEFVKPELATTCRRLANPFYHLDGKGQLPHLDSLLAVPELKGVQWVPGAGMPRHDCWPEVYRKIRAAGKLVQLWGPPDVFDRVVEQLGSAKGLVAFVDGKVEQEEQMRAWLAKYGIE